MHAYIHTLHYTTLHYITYIHYIHTYICIYTYITIKYYTHYIIIYAYVLHMYINEIIQYFILTWIIDNWAQRQLSRSIDSLLKYVDWHSPQLHFFHSVAKAYHCQVGFGYHDWGPYPLPTTSSFRDPTWREKEKHRERPNTRPQPKMRKAFQKGHPQWSGISLPRHRSGVWRVRQSDHLRKSPKNVNLWEQTLFHES